MFTCVLSPKIYVIWTCVNRNLGQHRHSSTHSGISREKDLRPQKEREEGNDGCPPPGHRFLPGCAGNKRQSDCTALPVVARQTVRQPRRTFKRIQPPNAGFADTRSGRREERRQRAPVPRAWL